MQRWQVLLDFGKARGAEGAWVCSEGGGRWREVASIGRGGGGGTEFPTMPRQVAAADGCCGKGLPFAARQPRADLLALLQWQQPLSVVRRPGLSSGGASAPSGGRRSGSLAEPQLLGGRGEGATGGSRAAAEAAPGAAARAPRGGADPRGVGQRQRLPWKSPGPPARVEADQCTEEKLRNLTFRKQVSYR